MNKLITDTFNQCLTCYFILLILQVIRKRIKLAPEKALFLFCGNSIPPNAALMSTVYEEQKDEDGFLYIQYSGESTFGFGKVEEEIEEDKEE